MSNKTGTTSVIVTVLLPQEKASHALYGLYLLNITRKTSEHPQKMIQLMIISVNNN